MKIILNEFANFASHLAFRCSLKLQLFIYERLSVVNIKIYINILLRMKYYVGNPQIQSFYQIVSRYLGSLCVCKTDVYYYWCSINCVLSSQSCWWNRPINRLNGQQAQILQSSKGTVYNHVVDVLFIQSNYQAVHSLIISTSHCYIHKKEDWEKQFFGPFFFIFSIQFDLPWHVC